MAGWSARLRMDDHHDPTLHRGPKVWEEGSSVNLWRESEGRTSIRLSYAFDTHSILYKCRKETCFNMNMMTSSQVSTVDFPSVHQSIAWESPAQIHQTQPRYAEIGLVIRWYQQKHWPFDNQILVGGDWNTTFVFFHPVGNNHPNWFHMFQRGCNHQPEYIKCSCGKIPDDKVHPLMEGNHQDLSL